MATNKKRVTVYLGADDQMKLEFLVKEMDAEDVTEAFRRIIRKEYREYTEDKKELTQN